MHWYVRRVAAMVQPALAPVGGYVGGVLDPPPLVLASIPHGAAIVVVDASDWPAAHIAALVSEMLQAFQHWAESRPLFVQCIVLLEHGLPAGIGRVVPRLDRAAGDVHVALHIVDGRTGIVHSGSGAAWVSPKLLLQAWVAGPPHAAVGGEERWVGVALRSRGSARGEADGDAIAYPRRITRPPRTVDAPILTYSLLALIAALHGLAFVLGDFVPGLSVLALFGAQVNALVLEYGHWWRPLTAMFLHANLLHLGMNSLALFQLGPVIEAAFGRGRLLVIWFAAGLAGNWLYLWQGPPETWSVGASGAIFGLFGALVVLGLRLRASIRPAFWWQTAVTLGINVYIGLAVPQINMWAHAGGFIAGLAWAAAMVLTPSGRDRRLAVAAAAVGTVVLAVLAYLQV